MEKFLVSMMRFSTAMTLFGLEQVQTAVTSVGSGDDLTSALKQMQEAMDAFSSAVMGQVDDGKKETLETVTKVSEDTVKRAFSGVSSSMIDPREALRVTTDMIKKTSDSVVGWVEGSGQSESSGKPKQAAEALSRSGKGKATAKAGA